MALLIKIYITSPNPQKNPDELASQAPITFDPKKLSPRPQTQNHNYEKKMNEKNNSWEELA